MQNHDQGDGVAGGNAAGFLGPAISEDNAAF